MKNVSLKLGNVKETLTKAQMKMIKGGASYKCCWDDHPTSCSECANVVVPGCTSGSSPKLC
jgi:hypothetical protein